MSNSNKPEETQKYYSHIQINLTLRRALWVLASLTWVGILFFTTRYQMNEYSWQALAFWCFIAAIPLLVFPSTEAWVYEKWQAAPQKYDHHNLFDVR